MSTMLTTSEQILSPWDEHNQKLLENVRPPGWENPAAKGRYNLVVIGAGTAGLVAAVGAATLGARVAIVEKHLLGGDCLNYGCVPSKAVIRAARAAFAAREAAEYGIHAEGLADVSFFEVMRRMRRLRATISEHDSAHRLARLGVDVFLGSGRFVARDAIEVVGQRLTFAKAVIATGGRATGLPIPGLAEAGFLTNETVFSLTELPRRLCVVGAGPIGCELAQAFRRLGSSVSLLELMPRILPREDADAARLLSEQLEREGIRVVVRAQIRRVDTREGTKVIVFDQGNGEERVVADQILLGVGRAPNVEDLDLPAAGVAFDKTGVRVDDRLRTTNPRIYAAGDVCSEYKFTHAADAMARIVLQNALFFGRKKASRLVIPWCTYTDPEIAHVGLYEQEARDRGYDVTTLTTDLADVDRAVLDGESRGFARVHVDRRTGRILGATLVSRHAGESIGEVTLAMTKGLKVSALSETIHPYPTQAEAWKRIGDMYLRSRLKPWLRTVLEKFLSLRR